MTEQKLFKLLQKGDDLRCVAFFQNMSEPERRALAPVCQKWYKTVSENWLIQVNPNTYQRNPLMPAAEVAMFATTTLSELKKRPFHTRPDDEYICQLLIDRNPKWVSDWVPTLLEEPNYWHRWTLIRQLIAAGLANKPDHPNYYLAMISGIGGRFDDHLSIEKKLLQDPELLEDEIWRLFEYDGGGENSLANWDRFTNGQTWQDALLSLANQGYLPRRRLLECSMEALERDFNHYRAKWYSSFYDALQPTAEERREHADRYLGLLGVSAPNIVSWAFTKVEAASKAGLYQTDALVAGISPVLGARAKGIVKKALRLMKHLAKQDPQSSPTVAEGAVAALGHEEVDVQEAALELIERLHPIDPRLESLLADYHDLVAPSLRRRIKQLSNAGGADAAKRSASEHAADPMAIEVDHFDPELRSLFGIDALLENLQQRRFEIPAASFDGMNLARLDPRSRLTPLDNLDDLIDACARVIEDDLRIDDAELAIDGLARLGDQKPEDFETRVGPLFKRVRQQLRKVLAPFIGFGPSHDLRGLVYAWVTGTVIRASGNGNRRSVTVDFEGETYNWYTPSTRQPIAMLSRRSLAVAEKLAEGKSSVLLSAATHSGGWIDPRVLVDRVNRWNGPAPDLTDACLAMLRCAPDHRQQALDQLRMSVSEWERAIRHALGGKGVQPGKTEPLWAAAARARAPWEDDPAVAKAFPKLGPDGAVPATYDVQCRKLDREDARLEIKSKPSLPRKVHPDAVTIAWHNQLEAKVWKRAGVGQGSVAWTATIWPQARESFFAAAALELASNLDWWEAEWHNKNFLKPLLDPNTPLREMGLLLLAVALAAKEPGEHGLATDVAICAIEDGRLGSDNFGSILTALLPTGLVMPTRWAKTLGQIARVSLVHAAVVRGALQRSFRGDPSRMPRNLGKLLELMKELSIEMEQGIVDEETREFLKQIKGTSKAAKMAKALLSIPSDASFESSRLILDQAIRQRVERRLIKH